MRRYSFLPPDAAVVEVRGNTCNALSRTWREILLVAWLGVITVASPTPVDASAIHTTAPYFTRINGAATIPATTINGAMFVDAKVNGAGPFHMIVDTGCSLSLISPEMALAISPKTLPVTTDSVATNGFGNSGTMQPVLLNSIQIGPVRFEEAMAGVVSLDIQSRAAGQRVDGILGYTLFSDLYLTMDFPHERLILSEETPRELPAVRAALDITEHMEVPFVTVAIEGRRTEVMIDTGATGSIQLSPTIANMVTWKADPRPAGLVAVIGEAGREWMGRLAGTLEIGDVRQAEPVASISGGTASIGMGILRSFCIVFHPAQDRMWLCSDDPPVLPSPPPRSVGLSLLANEAGWSIAGTIPGSPAERARLAPGNIVTEIEHLPARDWSRDEIQKWIDGHDALALSVSSDTGTRELTLPVWSIVP